MQNLKHLNDSTLIEKTEKLVRQEREILASVLDHLREIDRRKLFSHMKYKSLYEFATKHLGYPADQAVRRISAMRLLKELPQIEEKIIKGDLNLTHLNLANSLFNQEKKAQNELSHEEKLEVFDRIAKTSSREAESITRSFSSNPEILKPDQTKQVSAKTIEMKFQASVDLLEKIEVLKGRLAHSNSHISLGELFEKLCDLGLETWDPSQIKRQPKTIKKKEKSQKFSTQNSNERDSILPTQTPEKPTSQAQIRREVFQRSQNKCEKCGSSYALEIDHCYPRSLGGSDDFDNLRVLCKSCNQRAAIETFGQMKMDFYLG